MGAARSDAVDAKCLDNQLVKAKEGLRAPNTARCLVYRRLPSKSRSCVAA